MGNFENLINIIFGVRMHEVYFLHLNIPFQNKLLINGLIISLEFPHPPGHLKAIVPNCGEISVTYKEAEI